MSEENNFNFSKKFRVCITLNIIFSIIFLILIGIMTYKASVLLV